MKGHALNIPASLRKGAAYSSVGERMLKTGAHVEAEAVLQTALAAQLRWPKPPCETKESKYSPSCSPDCFGRQTQR